MRAAFGAIVREAGNLSAGVFNADGEMLAQAITGTPGHVNTMAASVKAMLSILPSSTLSRGDVLVTNDPWLGAGHVFDFVVVTPVFVNDKIFAYLASTSHIVDVGGLGWPAEARTVYEEGVTIPVMHLRRVNTINEDLLGIVTANSRVPHEPCGDILSLLTCNDTGAKRLIDLMLEYRLNDLCELSSFIFERSEQGTKAALQLAPNGDLNYSAAYAAFGIRALLTPLVPNNQASLNAVRISAPPAPGLVVSAERPSPVSAQHVIGHALPDLMFGCLEQALPGEVLAESAGALWTLSLSGTGESPFTSLNVVLGGYGRAPVSRRTIDNSVSFRCRRSAG